MRKTRCKGRRADGTILPGWFLSFGGLVPAGSRRKPARKRAAPRKRFTQADQYDLLHVGADVGPKGPARSRSRPTKEAIERIRARRRSRKRKAA